MSRQIQGVFEGVVLLRDLHSCPLCSSLQRQVHAVLPVEERGAEHPCEQESLPFTSQGRGSASREPPCPSPGKTGAGGGVQAHPSLLSPPAHHERLQRSPNHRPRWLRGGLRLPEGGHGQNVTGMLSHGETHPGSEGAGEVPGASTAALLCQGVAGILSWLQAPGAGRDITAVGRSWVLALLWGHGGCRDSVCPPPGTP